MINALQNSVLTPKMEINPPKTTHGCPWGGETEKQNKKTRNINNKNGHICNLLNQWNAFVSVQLLILSDPQSFQPENAATRAFKNITFREVG